MNRLSIRLISSIAALGGLLFGFDTAIVSGAIPFLTAHFRLDGASLGWAVSCVLVGCALGALMAGSLADRYGRRFMLFVCAGLFAVSGLGTALADSLSIFVIFRIIGGLGVGAAAMVSPMYIAEIAPEHERGRLVSLYQLAIMLGILLAYITNYLLAGGPESWRWMFAAQVLPSVLFGALLFNVPETPRWFQLHGQRMAGDAKPIQPRLTDKRYRRVLTAGILIAIFQQVTGINAILYYAPVIFKQTGLDTGNSILQTIGIGVVNVLATLIAIGLVDRVGRRHFLLCGSLVMGLALTVTAMCFKYHYFSDYIVLAAMLIYVGAFCCTLGAVTWVYLSEIFPTAIRGRALSLATLALWLADFVVAATFPSLAAGLGTAGTLLVYALFCGLCYLFVWQLPETKGLQLEDMEHVFINKNLKK